ncbi:beta transducin [Bonamia ostreae]|uniref:Beta transducin n=1 Tax=Bonamia ostreae TaxID=126728 RepID=A0ABV2AJT9_9EUKA
MVLRGHCGEINGMAVSKDFFVSVSNDNSIRIWTESDEMLFLEEEKEAELNRLFQISEKRDIENETKPSAVKGSGLSIEAQSDIPKKQSKSQIIEEIYCLFAKNSNLGESDFAKKENLVKGDENLFAENNVDSKTCDEFLAILTKFSFSDFENALYQLFYYQACSALKCIDFLINDDLIYFDRLLRTALLLSKLHEKQITTDQKMINLMKSIKSKSCAKARKWRNLVSFNCVCLSMARKAKKKSLESDRNLTKTEDSIISLK